MVPQLSPRTTRAYSVPVCAAPFVPQLIPGPTAKPLETIAAGCPVAASAGARGREEKKTETRVSRGKRKKKWRRGERKEKGVWKGGEREGDRGRQTDRQTETDRDRQTDRQTETDRD
eukprot:2884082-Rhodomonas_salina.1